MAVSTEANRLKASGVDIVTFGAGEPDFPTPENIKNAAIQALNENFTKYTPAGGITQLKDAICQYHTEYFGTHYNPSECIVCVGGKHVIFNTVAALVEDAPVVRKRAREAGVFDKIISTSTMYSLYSLK